MEERGQDIVCNLICNVSMNIHSFQLTLAFIPVAQSRHWLKEGAFTGVEREAAHLSVSLSLSQSLCLSVWLVNERR